VNSILSNTRGGVNVGGVAVPGDPVNDLVNNQPQESTALLTAAEPNIVSAIVALGAYDSLFSLPIITGVRAIDPELGFLENNGGPTETIAPLPGSPAIDAGDSLASGLPSTDQRGFLRISGAAVDLGAFEVQMPVVSPAMLPNGTYGTAYSPTTITAAEDGYAGSFSLAITAGTLPNGLNLAPNGAVGGTPTAAGSFAFTVTATDSGGYTGSQAYTLGVLPAMLTVTANNASRVYGQANPAFTASYGVFVNGDTANSLGGALSFSTPATVASSVGQYAITPSGLTSSNYTIVFGKGTLTINPDATTTSGSLSASSVSFGQPLTVTASITANAPGSGTPTGTVDFYDTTAGLDLGSYAISSGLASVTAAALPAGNNTIILSYSGDNNFLPSSATVTVTENASILVLDPTASGALSLSGNARINVAGTVVVDSNSSSALTASGNAALKAASIQIVGKVQKSGNASFSPTPVTGTTVVADPLAHLAAPSTSGLTDYDAVAVSGSTFKMLSPGIYSQISISGGAKVTLNPGVYIIEGGGLTVSGGASLTGSGILIYNTGSKYPNAGGSYGAITLSGSGMVNLSAATGPYAGIVIDQDPKNTQTLTLSGSVLAITGTVYAPKAQLVLSGNAQLNATLDVDLLTMSGSAVDNTASGGAQGAGGSGVILPSPTPIAELIVLPGRAVGLETGFGLLDDFLAFPGETSGFLATWTTETVEAPLPGEWTLPFIAREAEAVIAARRSVVNGSIFHGANLVPGMEDGVRNRSDAVLVDPPARRR
jgi:hypothetical protein